MDQRLLTIAQNLVSPTRLPTTIGLISSQLLLSTFVVGFSKSNSWIRPAALPVLYSYVYRIIKNAPREMRARWCGLVGGIAYLYLLQYINVTLLSRWSYETHSDGRSLDSAFKPSKKQMDDRSATTAQATPLEASVEKTEVDGSFWSYLSFGWSTMVSFRHAGTPWEVRNVPLSKRNDPTYVPSRGAFLLKQSVAFIACYLVLGLLDQRPAPTNAEEFFHPSRIPFFTRLSEVTIPELRLRIFSTFGFAVTFFCIVQGFYSVTSVVVVGSGSSEVATCKPIFGSLSDTYTLRNYWGKVWHQCLRQHITSPANWLSDNVLKLEYGSLKYRLTTLAVAFLGSGVMHQAANLSNGLSQVNTGIFHFFLTQVCGILVEDAVQSLYKTTDNGTRNQAKPSVLTRCFGYTWVVTFLIWSVPFWIYPVSSTPVTVGPRSVLPFSVVNVLKSYI